MIRPGLLGSLTVISLAFLFAFTGSRNSQYAEDFAERTHYNDICIKKGAFLLL